jgi:hypothetical protein
VLFGEGTAALQALRRETRTIPIVFARRETGDAGNGALQK